MRSPVRYGWKQSENNEFEIEWGSQPLHLKMSSNCLLVIVLKLTYKVNVIVFKIVYPALMHNICLTAKTSQLFIILMAMLEMSVATMTKAKRRTNESVFM